jgi:signal transduction histidine kinase
VRDAVERSFRHIAESKHLAFDIEITPELPRSINTDVKRLQQVLKNLLSNAFKFTAQGRVTFKMAVVNSGWTPDHVRPEQRYPGGCLRGERHRNRHFTRQAKNYLRGFPPG